MFRTRKTFPNRDARNPRSWNLDRKSSRGSGSNPRFEFQFYKLSNLFSVKFNFNFKLTFASVSQCLNVQLSGVYFFSKRLLLLQQRAKFYCISDNTFVKYLFGSLVIDKLLITLTFLYQLYVSYYGQFLLLWCLINWLDCTILQSNFLFKLLKVCLTLKTVLESIIHSNCPFKFITKMQLSIK